MKSLMQYLLAYIIPLWDWHVLFSKLLSLAFQGMTAAQVLGLRKPVWQRVERSGGTGWKG